MYVIYKYRLFDQMPVTKIFAPFIQPISVDYQNGMPYLWAVVDDAAESRAVNVLRVGTGQFLGDNFPIKNYISTTVAPSAPYVWHWYWSEEGGN